MRTAVNAQNGYDAVRWIQSQAIAKGKPYDKTEAVKLADSAHIWAMYYERFGVPKHAECLAAAKILLGVSL